MMHVLHSYLAQYQSISIPGLGSLYLEKVPAQTDFLNKQMLAPSFHYRFDKYFDAPDKAFFTYLAKHLNIPDYEAIKQYNEWAYRLRNHLRTADVADWGGIGSFKKDEKGEIYFETAAAASRFLPAVPAERVMHQNEAHAIRVGDLEKTNIQMAEMLNDVYVEKESWWIYALVITALALGFIFYYLFSNDSIGLFGSSSNW